MSLFFEGEEELLTRSEDPVLQAPEEVTNALDSINQTIQRLELNLLQAIEEGFGKLLQHARNWAGPAGEDFLHSMNWAGRHRPAPWPVSTFSTGSSRRLRRRTCGRPLWGHPRSGPGRHRTIPVRCIGAGCIGRLPRLFSSGELFEWVRDRQANLK